MVKALLRFRVNSIISTFSFEELKVRSSVFLLLATSGSQYRVIADNVIKASVSYTCQNHRPMLLPLVVFISLLSICFLDTPTILTDPQMVEFPIERPSSPDITVAED